MNRKEAQALIETIIENNCIGCEEFKIALQTSACICDPVWDLINKELSDSLESFAVTGEWEHQRQKIVKEE